MRIGLVCPYSLTVPGGVQAQVLGLARALRASGHDARVLAPVRRPAARRRGDAARQQRPDRGERLGRADRARRRRRSCARSGRCATRGSTSSTCTSRSRPAPRMTALRAASGARWSARSTRPATAASYRWPRPGRALAGRPARPAVRGVATTRWRWRRGTSAATTSCCSTASRSSRSPRRAPTPTDGPTIFFLGRHEPRKGLAVLLEAMTALPARRAAVGGRRRPETERAAGSASPATRASSGSAAITEDEKRAPAAGRRRATARRRSGRVVRRGAARGDGGGHRRRGLRPRRLPQRGPRRPDALLVPPGDADGAGRGPAARARRPGRGPSAGRRRATSGPPSFSMDRLAERYVELYERAGRERGLHRQARLRRRIIGGHPVAIDAECSPMIAVIDHPRARRAARART